MADSHSESYEELITPLKNELKKILMNSKSVKKGPTTKFILNTTVVTEEELLRKERLGEKNDDKPHKVILMVGETGTGKTALINAMINYIMGVRWEHKIWLEVVGVSENQTRSQTAAVTVYEVFPQDSPFSLTVIDTPGFGDAENEDKDKSIPEALQQLFRSEDGIHEIHAVCVVLKVSETRLHERQQYILDEIMSLFGKDIEKHILLVFTHQLHKTLPQKVFNFIKESKIKCAKTKKPNEYICFMFDNCQSDYYSEEDRESYKASWDRGIENFKRFFDYLNGINPKSLDMTEGVLRARKQLDASVNNLKDRIVFADCRKQELEQTKAALEECEQGREKENNFVYEIDEAYKQEVQINSSWWHLSKQATRCTDCKENCHYPGCWWVKDLSWCSVMTDGKCTVCTGKCDHTKHVKDDKMYEIQTRKVKRTKEDLKKKYEKELGENKSVFIGLENEIRWLEAEKIRLVEECYQCLEKLMETALKSTSMSCFLYLDFMIEKVKETGKEERVQKLEDLKRRSQEENKGLIIRFNRYCKTKINNK
uniref:AAA+ ATPase domain-containing protein n=1 Tax=Cyprinus carpio TaxID=7962 RepID=A0A8C1SI59_CYPCA